MSSPSDDSEEARKSRARDSHVSPAALAAMAGDPSFFVRIDVAQNRNTPPEVLEALAKDEKRGVLLGVAGNPSTPPAVISALASDPEDEEMRRKAAGNPSAPVALLEALTTDPSVDVRSRVVCNPSLSSALLERLAGDDQWFVREAVVRNLRTPLAVIERLARDDDDSVRDAVATALRARGVEPTPEPQDPWTGCPLSYETQLCIVELGGVPHGPFDPAAPRPRAECSWARAGAPPWSARDEHGLEPTLPPVVAFLDRHLAWERGSRFTLGDHDHSEVKVTLSSASECFDTGHEGRRCLLYVVGYNDHECYCLDLLDDRDEPPVYVLDHEGGPPWLKYRTLIDWLAWLKPLAPG